MTRRNTYDLTAQIINSDVDGRLGEKETNTKQGEPISVGELRAVESCKEGEQSQVVDKVTPGKTRVITKLFSSEEVYSSEPEIRTPVPTYPNRTIQNHRSVIHLTEKAVT